MSICTCSLAARWAVHSDHGRRAAPRAAEAAADMAARVAAVTVADVEGSAVVAAALAADVEMAGARAVSDRSLRRR